MTPKPNKKKRKPIKVTDPNDPRLRAYQDSLNSYKSNYYSDAINDSLGSYQLGKPTGYQQGVIESHYRHTKVKPTHLTPDARPVFKKPVQPYELEQAPVDSYAMGYIPPINQPSNVTRSTNRPKSNPINRLNSKSAQLNRIPVEQNIYGKRPTTQRIEKTFNNHGARNLGNRYNVFRNTEDLNSSDNLYLDQQEFNKFKTTPEYNLFKFKQNKGLKQFANGGNMFGVSLGMSALQMGANALIQYKQRQEEEALQRQNNIANTTMGLENRLIEDRNKFANYNYSGNTFNKLSSFAMGGKLLTNPQGGTTGTHETGQDVPLYDEGELKGYGEPGEIVVDTPDGKVVLSKRSGHAQKYAKFNALSEAMKALSESVSDGVEGNRLKRISDINKMKADKVVAEQAMVNPQDEEFAYGGLMDDEFPDDSLPQYSYSPKEFRQRKRQLIRGGNKLNKSLNRIKNKLSREESRLGREEGRIASREGRDIRKSSPTHVGFVGRMAENYKAGQEARQLKRKDNRDTTTDLPEYKIGQDIALSAVDNIGNLALSWMDRDRYPNKPTLVNAPSTRRLSPFNRFGEIDREVNSEINRLQKNTSNSQVARASIAKLKNMGENVKQKAFTDIQDRNVMIDNQAAQQQFRANAFNAQQTTNYNNQVFEEGNRKTSALSANIGNLGGDLTNAVNNQRMFNRDTQLGRIYSGTDEYGDQAKILAKGARDSGLSYKDYVRSLPSWAKPLTEEEYNK